MISAIYKSYYYSISFSDDCRQLEFKPSHTFDNKRLRNHVIRTTDVMDGDFCEMACYMEPNCVSYNLKKAPETNGKYKCELNNSTFEGQKHKLKTSAQYTYRGAKVHDVAVSIFEEFVTVRVKRRI